MNHGEISIQNSIIISSMSKLMKFFFFSDLQLAAELGKTLLNRNKELEEALRQSHNLIDDQAQEIVVSYFLHFRNILA